MLWPWGSHDLLLLMASFLYCSKVVCKCCSRYFRYCKVLYWIKKSGVFDEMWIAFAKGA